LEEGRETKSSEVDPAIPSTSLLTSSTRVTDIELGTEKNREDSDALKERKENHLGR